MSLSNMQISIYKVNKYVFDSLIEKLHIASTTIILYYKKYIRRRFDKEGEIAWYIF